MNIFKKSYGYSIIVLAALIPSGLYQLTLAVVAWTGVCFLALKKYKDISKTFKQPQYLCLLLFYLYIAAGFFFSDNRGEALSSLSVYLQFLLFPLLLGIPGTIEEDTIRKAEKFFIYSVFLSLLAAVVYSIIDVQRTHELNVQIGEAVYNKYSSYGLTRLWNDWHPSYVALFANHAIFLLIQLIVDNYKKRNLREVFGYLSIFAFISASIFLLNSMIGIVSYIMILLYFTIVYLKHSDLDAVIKTILVGTFSIISVTFLYFNPFKIQKLETLKDKELKITDNYNERNLLTIRLAKWATHSDIIREYPVFGTTYGDIKSVREKAYEKRAFMDLKSHNYNAHNQFIEVLATYGIVGFSIFMAGLIIGLLKTRKRRFNLFLLITCVTFLTESLLLRQEGINYFVFFFVLYSVVPRKPTSDNSNLQAAQSQPSALTPVPA